MSAGHKVVPVVVMQVVGGVLMRLLSKSTNGPIEQSSALVNKVNNDNITAHIVMLVMYYVNKNYYI